MRTKTFKSEYIQTSSVKVIDKDGYVVIQFRNGDTYTRNKATNTLSEIELWLEVEFMSSYYACKIVDWLKQG